MELKEVPRLSSQIIELREANPSPTLVAIPGGPGLSAKTLLRGIGDFSEHIRTLLVNPPGTGSGVAQPDFSRIANSHDDVYQAVNASICAAVCERVAPHERIFLLGHSYGGVHAIDCAISMATSRAVVGLILVASPFTRCLFQILEQQIEESGSPELLRRRAEYFNSPCVSSYRHLCAAYGPLLQGHSVETGQLISSMLSTDECCGGAFAGYAKSFPRSPVSLTPQSLGFPTLAVLGELDRLVPLSAAVEECNRAGVETISVIPKAGHFPFVDAPEQFAATLVAWMHTCDARAG